MTIPFEQKRAELQRKRSEESIRPASAPPPSQDAVEEAVARLVDAVLPETRRNRSEPPRRRRS